METLRRIRIALLAIAFLSLVSSHPVISSDINTVTAEGVGNTREEAIASALREAVVKGLGLYLSSESMVVNSVLIRDRILSRAKGYIQTYSVEHEQMDNQGFVSVSLSATVTMNSIKNDLVAIGILMEQIGRPKILIVATGPSHQLTDSDLASEYMDKYKVPLRNREDNMEPLLNYAEDRCSEYILQRGFHILDSESANELRKLFRNATDINAEIKRISKKHGFQICILLDMNVSDQDFKRQEYWADARIQLRAFEVGSGELLGSTTSGSEGSNASGQDVARKEAIRSAVFKASNKMISQVLKKFEEMVNTGRPYEIRLVGCKDYTLAEEFKTILVDLPFYAGGMQMNFFEDTYKFSLSMMCNSAGEVINTILDRLPKDSSLTNLKIKEIQGTAIIFELQNH